MKAIKGFLFLAIITALCGFARFDDDILKNIATHLAQWSAARPQEKVYLQTDKPYYAVGDNIWFKAYVVTGGQHKLSAISGILNVQLIDDRDSIRQWSKLNVAAGLAWGDFNLPDSLAGGNYRIRAFTNWMRNTGEAYFFEKPIKVGNAISNNIFVKTAYTYTPQGQPGQQKVDAELTYTDLNGAPYVQKEVSYEVALNSRQVAKGKGITDDKGVLNVGFVSKTPAAFTNGNIATTVNLGAGGKFLKIVPVKAVAKKTDVQFFAESGTFLAGVRNRVAFKAVGADGLGVEVHGKITGADNTVIAEFATQHLGMGTFAMMPEAGATYTAEITYPDGSEGSVTLPKVNDVGYILSAYTSNNDPDNVLLKITTNQATLQQNPNSQISVVAQCGGGIIYTARTELNATVFATKIAKSRFPSGIAQFTLFSATGVPLNERIAFIQNTDTLKIALATTKNTFAPREKVKLNMTVKDKDDKPVIGAFSVSVIDERKVNVEDADEATIFSNLLLSSDIGGYVEKPNYYFTNANDKTRSDLDALMLTQGYRRFSWKQVLADNLGLPAFMPEKSLDITGHIKNGSKPVPHAKVSVFANKGGLFLLDTTTDEQGAFAFRNLVFGDSVKFVVQARNAKGGKNVDIVLDNIPNQAVTINKNAADIDVNISSSLKAYLQNSKTQYDDFLKYGMVNKTIMLKGVTITDKKAPILKHSDNLNGPGNADQVIKSDQLQGCATLSDCLLGTARFINFSGGKAYSTRSPRTPMLIVLDGMRMDNSPSFTLDDINSNDVASVEVLRGIATTAIYGLGSAGGVLVITTKRGDDIDFSQTLAPGLAVYHPKGYTLVRQFYSPQYDNPKTNVRVADLRTTIFWKPDIITDKDGASAVSYFNADTKGTYKAVIEGMDADGNIGRQVFRYKVE